MGLIDQALDRPDEAEEMFMKALYLDPHHYDALLHMTLLSDKKGDEARALVFRDRIKRLDQQATAPGGAHE
jgi:chemotaxis protein methyltransferase WspC